MVTTLDLLNRLCKENHIHSTREVANLLGISHMTVQNWRNGRSMSDDLACEVAVMLGLDPDFTLLAIMAERSKNERVFEAVERITKQKIPA